MLIRVSKLYSYSFVIYALIKHSNVLITIESVQMQVDLSACDKHS